MIPVIQILVHSQFEKALRLNVCLFVALWGKKDMVNKCSWENLCEENMISKYISKMLE